MPRTILPLCLLLALAGCAETAGTGTSGGSPGAEIPEEVAALAAPYQDVASARINPV